MQGTREIKRRIKSVKSTQQITKAMEMVAAAKLRKAQIRVEGARPYTAHVKAIIARLLQFAPQMEHSFLKEREEVKTRGYLVVTSDRGLAGGYNSNLLRKTKEVITGTEGNGIIAIGRKGRDFFRNRHFDIQAEYLGIEDAPSWEEVRSISGQASRLFLDGVYDELYLVYNEFINAMQHKPIIEKLLPLEPLVKVEEREHKEPYQFEPGPKETLDKLLPRYIDSLIFGALLEAKASEHGARMTAMGSATKNADEMIDKLTLHYNRARQSSITQEILEIVNGAQAL